MSFKNLMLITLLLFITSATIVAEEVELVPLKELFGNPAINDIKLSPDGKMISYIAPYEGIMNIWIRTVGQNDDRVLTQFKEGGFQTSFWAFDSRYILYTQDLNGDENYRLYAIDIANGDIRDLTPFADMQTEIINGLKKYPNELLIAMNKDNPQAHDAYKLNINTGVMQMVAKNPGDYTSWIADTRMQIRAAYRMNPDGSASVMIRDNDESDWRDLITWDFEDSLTSKILGFTNDGKGVFLLDSRGANTLQLVKMDIASGKSEILAQDPIYDAESAIINPDTFEVEAVLFNREKRDWSTIADDLKEDFVVLKKALPGYFEITSRDNADRNWLVISIPGNKPPSYFVYNRDTKKLTFLVDTQPSLNKYTFTEQEPVSFQARDGLTINGYITFPPGKSRHNLPMVLTVHGGPYSRDVWGFEPITQWFANRGYICLQINFRGSTGYGKHFLNAGDREWGGKMQDDLVDGVNWAITKGYADSTKVAIFGISYGGYAALVGATFTPDLFCCAVELSGPSNLVTFIKNMPPYWKPFQGMLNRRVGNVETEEEFLKSRSPLFKVDQIKIPILIAQGANDPRVKVEDSDLIVEAMKAKGLSVEYIILPDEGHGVVNPDNRLKLSATIEKFLALYLGGRIEE